jgi:hypothetical protein
MCTNLYGETSCGDCSTTTSTTTDTHSTTSTTNADTCPADLVQATGAIEECNECVGTYCCSEAVAYVDSPGQQTLADLFDCAIGADYSGPCKLRCIEPTCHGESPAAARFFHACRECIVHTCCTPFSDCYEDASCKSACVDGAEAACCEPGSSYKAYDDCVQAACGYVCPAAFVCPASHQGGAGSGT